MDEIENMWLPELPEWMDSYRVPCGGDPWAYGDDMQKVRAGAERCGLVPHNTQ